MSRLVLLALSLGLFSCGTVPQDSGLYSEDDNVLVERVREMYFDDNNNRRGRTVCNYRDGQTMRVQAGYNCPAVYPDEG